MSPRQGQSPAGEQHTHISTNTPAEPGEDAVRDHWRVAKFMQEQLRQDERMWTCVSPRVPAQHALSDLRPEAVQRSPGKAASLSALRPTVE